MRIAYSVRYTPLLLLLLCSSCQRWSWGGAADVLIPDELIVGHGSGQHDGVLLNHQDLPYHGESKSTSLALSWDIPSVKSDNGMSRETQRNFALLIDHMVAEEGLNAGGGDVGESEVAVTAGPLKLNLRPGVSLPSKEILFGVLGALLLVFLIVRYKANAAQRRW